MNKYDFGRGLVAAHQHQNPDGSIGGWVADSATVAESVFISQHAQVSGGKIFGGKILGGKIFGGKIWGGIILGGEIHGGEVWGGTIHGGEVIRDEVRDEVIYIRESQK